MPGTEDLATPLRIGVGLEARPTDLGAGLEARPTGIRAVTVDPPLVLGPMAAPPAAFSAIV